MKTKLKIFKFIALLALFNSFYSCQEDEILIESDKQTFHLKTSRISVNQVINEIKNGEIKQKLQNKSFVNSQSDFLLRSSDSLVYFIKKEKDDELISYILHLNSYSQSKPYFLKLIITQNNNETERMGYIKYIPTSPIAILDMSTFTGEVQILDNNFEVNATSNYVNGVKQGNLQNNGTQNRIICTDEIVITEVRCSHGGNHGVGQSCNNGLVNDAHYVISIFTRCTGDRTTPTQIIDDYGNPNSGETSSVNVGLALAHNFSLNLTSEQKLIYDLNPSIAEYLADNVIVVPDPSYNPILGGNPTMAIIDPEAENKVNNFINLLLELEDNPNILIEIPCDQLPQWIQIAQYNLPQSVLNKVSNLQNQNSSAVPNWDIQTLFGAGGAIVNMDFFPVTISQFPNNPNTNQPYSPEEFYNFFRLNINLFTQSSGVSFYPSTITGVNESTIWNSNNPLNAILSINMQPDSGSVICSNYNTNSWYFTTLTTPWAFSWSQDDYDGFHPVSGNREFGYYNDINGNSVFYVRGVDRIERGAVFTIADNTPWWDSPFSAADEKWNAMQENLKNYIETNGGVAVINSDNIYRPNWNDIKDVLSGVKPLSDLGCD